MERFDDFVPALSGRVLEPPEYLCEKLSCQKPLTAPDKLVQLLEKTEKDVTKNEHDT